MNDKQQFYKEFYSALEKAMEPSGGYLQEVDVPKNNGSMRGISIRFPNISASPTVYPDFYYQDWKDGQPMDEIVSGIRSGIMNTAPFISKFDINHITHEEAIAHLRAAVVNYDKNKEWLSTVPHERVADLAVYAKWDFENGYTAKVNDFLLAKTQLTKEEVLKIAKTNTAREVYTQSLDDVMADIVHRSIGDDEGLEADLLGSMPHCPAYVVRTKNGIDGAAAIADTTALKKVHEELGEDFYILPSSIHELLVIPKSNMDDVEALKDMVQSVNESDVEPEERLSDQVYEYDGHSLKLAGADLKLEHNISESITHHRSR